MKFSNATILGILSTFGVIIQAQNDPYDFTPADAVTLVLNLLSVSGGATVDNIVFAGNPKCAGIFTGGTSLVGTLTPPFPDTGIILSSGDPSFLAVQDFDSQTERFQSAGDSDLDVLAGINTLDACVLEFDFSCPAESGSQSSVVSFDYVFASDEYNEHTGSSFNDVFAFFLNDVNIAIIPGTTTSQIPVSINTINKVDFGALFYDNDPSENPLLPFPNFEADGFTHTLTATGPALSTVNHIKLAIADASDSSYDSWVLLQAGSFQCGPAPPTESYCCDEYDDGYCNHCVPFRSYDYCPAEYTFSSLISERTKAFRNNAAAVESAGYWFHYLEDKIAGYLLSVAEGVPVPEIYCCVTSPADLEACLRSSIPSTQTSIVIKATSFHSSHGVYALKNFNINAINNPQTRSMFDMIKGMDTSYADVVTELSALQATKIIVEEFIGSDLPTEYKFHVIDGAVVAIDVIAGRGSDCPCYAVIDIDGTRLDKYGCFEPGGMAMVDYGCPAIDFIFGEDNCGAVKNDLYLCKDLPPLDQCLLDEMIKTALQLAGAIGVYMRVDMFVVGNKFYVQEYSANHMNGMRHCAAKLIDGCIDSCYLGRLWDNAGTYGGGSAIPPVPPNLVNFRNLSAEDQCALLDYVTPSPYPYDPCPYYEQPEQQLPIFPQPPPESNSVNDFNPIVPAILSVREEDPLRNQTAGG